MTAPSGQPDSPNEEKIIRRKIRLKSQAVKLIRGEKEALSHRLALTKLKIYLETRTTQDFERNLSARLDVVQFLLDSLGTGLQTSEVTGDRY